ncbi:MAG: 1-deoxy-D-xylulose-5-phosphate reductoisomerase, partial [Candidatus Methylomirabilis sp.]|nr:1-deoxy-D-xylulose-5-phosphate reductoisomerase [Deltaproteobacteria bacterium]
VQALDLVRRSGGALRVVAMAAGTNVSLLAEQVRAYRPRLVSLKTPEFAEDLRNKLAGFAEAEGVEILSGLEGAVAVATAREADMTLSAFVGAAGLVPTYRAIEAGKSVTLANKETLVVAGEFIMDEARRRGVSVFPVDSEHSAIQQSLVGHRADQVRRIILTASGGPFRAASAEAIARATPEEALRHPNWSMGPKITIDSATLMNKGLEVIEARWLFGLPPEKVDVVVHPQSIIHSMVEYVDGSIVAQLGRPDMRIPLAYALYGGEHVDFGLEPLDFTTLGALTFERPDLGRFPCLRLAYEALGAGGTAPAVLNAANEALVERFLAREIGLNDIPALAEQVMREHVPHIPDSIEDLLAADAWARGRARSLPGGTREAP